MNTGYFFAIATAASFALSQVLVRRVTFRAEESFTAVAVSVIAGTPAILLVLAISGEWPQFLSFSGSHYILLASAGLVHMVLARFLYFTSTRLLGANPTAAVTQTSIIFSIVFGIVFLGESLTGFQVAGAMLIMTGAVLTNTTFAGGSIRISAAGLLLGLGTAVCSATSGTLIRSVVESTGAVFAATTVMYLAAFFAVILIISLNRKQRYTAFGQPFRSGLILSISGLILLAGHLFRSTALKFDQVSLVLPLVSSTVIFVLFFSWILNRRIDIFNWRIFSGILMVMAGIVLIYL